MAVAVLALAAGLLAPPLYAEVGERAAADALLLAYGAAIEQEDLNALVALHWKPDELKRRVRERWAPLFDQYNDLNATHETLLFGSTGDRALVRYRYKVTGVKARSRDRQRYILRAGIYDTLMARTDSGWRLTEKDWPQPDLEGEIQRVLRSAADLPSPSVLQLVLAHSGGRWRPIRPFVWYGQAIPAERTQTDGGEKTASVSPEQAVAAILEARGEQGKPGTISVFLQKVPPARARRPSRDTWTALDPVWTPADDEPDDEALRQTRARTMKAFGDASAHDAYAAALWRAGEFAAAVEERQKAYALDPSEQRAAALATMERRLANVAEARQWTLEMDARRAARLRQEQVRIEQDRSALAARKPPNVMVNEAFVLRFHRGDPTATLVMAALEEAQRRITELFGFPMRSVEVNIFASRPEYLAFRRFRGETRIPEWSGGTSGVDGILTFSQPDVRRTMLHEYGHEAVKQFTNDAPVPYWLNEGIATAIEGAPPNYEELVSQMAASRDVFDVWQLSNAWTGMTTEAANRAYAQSRSMAEFLLAKVGRQRFLSMLQDLRSRVPFEAAFQRYTGVSQAEFLDLWLAEVSTKSNRAATGLSPE